MSTIETRSLILIAAVLNGNDDEIRYALPFGTLFFRYDYSLTICLLHTLECPAAVDNMGLSRGEGTVVTGKIQRQSGNLFGFAYSP